MAARYSNAGPPSDALAFFVWDFTADSTLVYSNRDPAAACGRRNRPRSGGCLFRRRHEFRSDGVFDGFSQNPLNGALRFVVERPAENVVHGDKLLRLSRSPQRNGLAYIENPAQG